MNKITWAQACKNAIEMVRNSNKYAYFYGAKGQVLTDAVMEALWRAEPAYFSQYNAEQKKQIFNYSRGKIGYDCSGFVCAILKGTGVSTYSLGLWSMCVKNRSIAEGKAGSILIVGADGSPRGRHVGFDLGLGYYVHMGKEMQTIRLERFAEKKFIWEQSGEISCINYAGATAM